MYAYCLGFSYEPDQRPPSEAHLSTANNCWYAGRMQLQDLLVGQLPTPTDKPFPHISFYGAFNEEVLNRVLAEFPGEDSPYWKRYGASTEAGKMEMSDPNGWPSFTAEVLEVMTGQSMCDLMAQLFNIPNLVGSTLGGGLHCSPAGARLAMHTDFTHHPETNLFRRLNLLVFLNKDWQESWGGGLYLGRRKEVLVQPRFNQIGVFATSSISAHGHPIPWNHSVPRRSLAAYFFSPEPPAHYAGPTSTVWTEE